VTFIFEEAALSSDSSSVSDKRFLAKYFRFFFIRQEWLILGLSLLIKLIIGAYKAIEKKVSDLFKTMIQLKVIKNLL